MDRKQFDYDRSETPLSRNIDQAAKPSIFGFLLLAAAAIVAIALSI